MYSVYILLCSDNTLYTGIAQNIEKRFQEHKEGKGSKYTRARKAVKIVYSKRCRNKSYALKREAEIKRLTRKKKDELINQK
ncbi:GIY-YIG nuclease family protein [Patescibacteria group bacterium]|nr:GIY-YIG nuclease family protein [Patescibacteria group bacterium]MBU1673825.1 GIY-YIG nuclease family protein [Patescibacteria group bacterium]MBU1964072.1 GIY-YIG nuclease family protein [Patescibacteria group bacterium]